MSKIVTLAKQQIEDMIRSSAKKAMEEGLLPEAELTPFKIEIINYREFYIN